MADLGQTDRSILVERLRILHAARDGRLKYNEYGRYFIDGGKRPARKERERLMRQGFIFLHPSSRVLGCAADAEIAGLEAMLRGQSE